MIASGNLNFCATRATQRQRRIRANKTEGGLMSDNRLPTTAFKSEWGEAAQRAARAGEFEGTGQRTTTRRTVGVYERPARRAKLSLPFIVILILATLISLILSARFLF
jgi:hypothetical protein